MNDYSLQDFLLFSPAVYHQMVDMYQKSFATISYAVNVALLCLLVGVNQPQTPRLVALVSAFCCAWLGWRFYIIDYASINWFAIALGCACLMLVPMFFYIAYLVRQQRISMDKPLFMIAIGYLCLFRPVLVFALTEQWQVSPIGLTPAPTLLLLVSVFLAFQGGSKWLSGIMLLSMIVVESITLYLVQDPMWQELPLIVILLAMLVGSQRHLPSRRRLQHH